VAALLVQAAATVGADAPNGDAQLSTDFVVCDRGSSMSSASSRPQSGGKSAKASRNATWRSASSSSCSSSCSATAVLASGCSWPYVYPAARGRRAVRKASAHSREVVVASRGDGGQPARKGGWVADSVELVYQLQSDSLADVLGVGAV
jgi:hypothetical protein